MNLKKETIPEINIKVYSSILEKTDGIRTASNRFSHMQEIRFVEKMFVSVEFSGFHIYWFYICCSRMRYFAYDRLIRHVFIVKRCFFTCFACIDILSQGFEVTIVFWPFYLWALSSEQWGFTISAVITWFYLTLEISNKTVENFKFSMNFRITFEPFVCIINIYNNYEWAKRTKFLLAVIYGSPCRH